MIKDIIDYLKDKEIIILGFGREGKATYKLIRKYLPEKHLTIGDSNIKIAEDELVKDDLYVDFILGETYMDTMDEYDLIMKSPGIPFNKIDLTNIKDKISSELELLLRFYKGKVIGVTGTKGKSTTSSLIYQMIKDQGYKTTFAGNIGLAVFEVIEDLEDVDYLVLEMGCHQLEFMHYSPNYSIFLNVYEEHLDHYRSYDNYIEAKCNIFSHQNDTDYYFYNADSKLINEKNKKFETNANRIGITFTDNNKYPVYIKDNYIYINDKKVYDGNSERKLLGRHNLNNIMFILALADVLKLDLDKAIETINSFESLPHRMELVGTYNGVTYYNDSISTIPEACINAMESIKVNSLIIGGLDRGIDYSKLIDYLNNSDLTNLICMPTTGEKIGNSITNKNINVYLVKDLEEAVKKAKEVTKDKEVCLMSPAAASYNTFKNFEERGNRFKELVRE